MDGLYDSEVKTDGSACEWTFIQQLALENTAGAITKIQGAVLQAQRDSVRLPMTRKAITNHEIKDEAGQTLFRVEAGQTIICDPYASHDHTTTPSDFLDIAFPSRFTNVLSAWHPKDILIPSLTCMVKVLAQMKNLRRGHDTQGKLKQIRIPSLYEGYGEYMAEGRMHQIQNDVDNADTNLDDLFNTKILKPEMETYLTPEWDEMVPFPTSKSTTHLSCYLKSDKKTAWKVRFEGFGASNYSPSMLAAATLPDNFPPFYQPRGPSATGGTFGDADHEVAHNAVPALTSGCGV